MKKGKGNFMKCSRCGNEKEGNFCPKCGAAAQQYTTQQSPPPPYGQPPYAQPPYAQPPYSPSPAVPYVAVSTKDWLVALLLCIFLGGLGVHRFYVGKVGTGILYLFTGGLLGIGVIVDIILIATKSFRDKYGLILQNSYV